MKSHYFLYSHHEIDEEKIQKISEKINEQFHCSVQPYIYNKEEINLNTGDTVFVMISDEDFKVWFKLSTQKDITIIILPFEKTQKHNMHLQFQ